MSSEKITVEFLMQLTWGQSEIFLTRLPKFGKLCGKGVGITLNF